MAGASDPALSLCGLTVAYHASPVLWNIDLDINPGQIMGIVGPNGAGKSTLLKAVLGVMPTLAGSIKVLGKPANRVRAQIGYVPQRTSVDWDFPISVLDLVMMGTYGRLGWFRRPGSKQRQEAMAALDLVEMGAFANRQIGELSGGQQQRVFLARAFVQDAPLYLMDEPFAGVDATTEKAIIRLLHQMRDAGKTLIVVHHDLTTVREYFDQVSLLNRSLVASGPVERVFSAEAIAETYGDAVHRAFSRVPESESESTSATTVQRHGGSSV